MNILAELAAQCERRGIRIEANGDMLKVDAPKGALSPDLLALLKEHKGDLLAVFAQPAPHSDRHSAPQSASRSDRLAAILVEACQGVPGIDAATFRALLSPDDAKDVEGGHIPMVTLNAYARSFADGIRTGRFRVLAPAIAKPAVTERVRCADCRHFERDTIGDGSGIGRCKVCGEGTGPRCPALWANAERECKDFGSRGGRGMEYDRLHE